MLNIHEIFQKLTDIYKSNIDPALDELYTSKVCMYAKCLFHIPMINYDYINLPKIIGLINIMEQEIDLNSIISNSNLLKYCQNILEF